MWPYNMVPAIPRAATTLQEMDYDVLVFESSILDCHIAWEEIKKGEDPYQSFGKGVFKFWTVSKYTTELIKYLGDQAQSDNPLILSGFDMQFSGMMGLEERVQHIVDFLKEGPNEVHIENARITYKDGVTGKETKRAAPARRAAATIIASQKGNE